MDESEKWKKRVERERAARREAEQLLESKSLELYEANQRLAREVAQKGSQLEEREQLFQSVFYASMDGIILLNRQGEIMGGNHSFLKMLGVEEERLVGKTGASLYAEQHRELARNAFHEVLETGYCRFECDIVRIDGSVFPAEIVWSRAEVGGDVVVNGVIRDVAQRRRHMEQLRAAHDEAERANQAKSLFLASMSHEIRTPLNGVLGFTELVLGTDLSVEQRRYLDLVKSSGDILIEIINDLLDFSKIESGQMILEDKEYQLASILDEIMEVHSQQAKKKDLALSLELDQSLPDRLVGDAVRVRQVVTNLVSNAVKFTEEGFVKMRARGENGLLEISVEDSGIGFDDTKKEMLFDAFTQADVSTTRRFGGTGLGLAICRTLAQAMDGDIEAHGELGKGARFVFTIPLRAGEVVVTQEEQLAEREESIALEKRFILIAEDNDINARLLTVMLQRLGHDSRVVKSGHEVLCFLQGGERCDAIFMDRHMPEMDGVEATWKIRGGEAGEEFQEIPIVAVTASALEEDRKICEEVGMNGFLAKPLRPAELEQLMESLF